MKKIILPLVLVFVSALSIAQDYTIKSSTKVEGASPQLAAIGEREIETHIKGKKIRTEMTSMMGTEIRVFDGKNHTFLSDNMGNKMGYIATAEEIAAESKPSKNKHRVEYLKEKKNIAGYECSKAIITSTGKDELEQKAVVWYTDKIDFDLSDVKKDASNRMLDMGDLKGYPLGIEVPLNIQGQAMKLIITTTDVNTQPVDEGVFAVNTEGYKMVKYKELLDLMKSMAGAR